MRKQVLVSTAFLALFATSLHAQTPSLFDLARTGTPQEVREAIVRGAKLEERDKDGATPLFAAAWQNPNAEVIAVLLRAGADIKARDNDDATPLMYAAMNNTNPEVVSTLLQAGADATAKDNDGRTAFDYAQENEN